METAKLPEELARFAGRRTSQRRSGLALLIAGLATVANFYAPLPIPLVGLAAVVLGSAGAVLGWTLYQRSRRLPVPEALRLATFHQGRLTKAVLVMELRLEPAEAEELLELLAREELIETDLTDLDPALELPSLERRYRVRGLPEPESLGGQLSE